VGEGAGSLGEGGEGLEASVAAGAGPVRGCRGKAAQRWNRGDTVQVYISKTVCAPSDPQPGAGGRQNCSIYFKAHFDYIIHAGVGHPSTRCCVYTGFVAMRRKSGSRWPSKIKALRGSYHSHLEKAFRPPPLSFKPTPRHSFVYKIPHSLLVLLSLLLRHNHSFPVIDLLFVRHGG
jgi:hypothetical protein